MILRQARRGSSNRKRILGLAFGFGILAAVILPFALQGGAKPDPAFIHCDLETKVDWNGRPSYSTTAPDVFFVHAESQNMAYARSGKYSCGINKGNEYGVALENLPVTPGSTYIISLWRKQGEGQGLLVVSGDWGFYENKDIPVELSDGWGRLSITVRVPKGLSAPKLSTYAWNPKDETSYFDDFSIVETHQATGYELPKYEPSELEQVNLVVSDNAMDKLADTRLKALQQGLLADKEEWVKAKMEYNGQKIPCRIRLKGDWTDHLQGMKWSFRVELEDGFAWKRMVIFSFQNPQTRFYLHEWLYHEFLRSEGLLTPRYDFINLTLNNRSLGIYAYEEHFAKQMIEYNKRREGPIVKFNEEGFWEVMRSEMADAVHLEPLVPIVEAATEDAFGMKGIVKDSAALQQFLAAETLLHQFKTGARKSSEVFDLDQVAKYYAIVDVFRAHHGLAWHNQRYYYNPVLQRLEPIGFDAYTPNGPFVWSQRPFFGHSRNPRYQTRIYWELMFEQMFADPVFAEKYTYYLHLYSNPAYIRRFLDGHKSEIEKRELLMKKEFASYDFDWTFFPHSAKRIHRELYPLPSLSVKAHLLSKSGGWTYDVFNFHCLPVRILGFGNENGELKHPLVEPVVLPALPEANIPDHIEITAPEGGAWIIFQIPGMDSTFSTPTLNWSPPHPVTPSQDLFAEVKVENNPLYSVSGDQIHFKKGKFTVRQMLIIPKGYTVNFPPGCQLDFVQNAGFISRSPVIMAGSPTEPVLITSSDHTGNAFTVLQADTTSHLINTIFDNLNTLRYKGWNLTGATNFYESPLEMEDCKFQNNHCEDALNIIRSKFLMLGCEVSKTAYDGFDCDFCDGLVENSHVFDTGNDGLDFSGSSIHVRNTLMERTGDKGISVGEESNVRITKVTIKDNDLGVASKDLSEVMVESLTLENVSLGFACYQKKPEYGGSSMVVQNHTAKNVSKLHNIQVGSTLVIGTDTIRGKL